MMIVHIVAPTKCPFCGKPLKKAIKRCPHCGKPLPTF